MSGVKASTLRAALVTAIGAYSVPSTYQRFAVSTFRQQPIPLDGTASWGHLDFDVRYGPSVSVDRGRVGSQIKTAYLVTFGYRMSAGATGQQTDEDEARDLAELVAGVCLLTPSASTLVLEQIETVTYPQESRIVATIGLTVLHALAGA